MRAEAFTGRTRHLEALSKLLHPGPGDTAAAPILYVHGPTGIGKTALLHRCAVMARDAERQVVLIDAAQTASATQLRERIARRALRAGAVLLLDDIDAYPGAMPRVAAVLAELLPENAVAVLAGQEAPDPRWVGEAGWHGLVDFLPLGPLTQREADEVLTEFGAPADLRPVIAEFGQGHPLALTLGAAAARAGRFVDGELPQELVLHLLDRVIGEVPSPAHRAALEISAHSRWTTEDLLRSVLGADEPTADVFDWLRRRPYVISERHGVAPCPLVRNLLDSDVRWRDPSGYRRMHERIRQHVLDQIRLAPPDGIVQATLALTYLHRRNGFVSRFVTWRTHPHVREVPYRPELREELLRFIAGTSGDAAAETASRWLRARPRAFRLYWDVERQEPVGALAWLHLDGSGHQNVVAQDPLAAAAWRHAQNTRPLRPEEHVALIRLYGPATLLSEASPLLDLMIHRILASFIVQESTAWTYLGLASGNFLDPLMRYIDQRPLRDPVVSDGTSFTLYAHDWRAVTLEHWMEVGHLVELAGPDARPAARSRTGPGALAVLSRDEFDAAVAEALAAWQRRDLLARNPLTRTRMVTEHGGGDPVEALRELITEALDTLGGDPRLEKYHRAVVTGLLRGAPTREAAAERLGLPLSTFRRHLARGVDEIRAYLWNADLRS